MSLKKLFLILFFISIIINVSTYSYAKDYNTIFGFKMSIPENYLTINNHNVGEATELILSDKEVDINADMFNNLSEGMKLRKLEFLYNKDLIKEGKFISNINISSSIYKYVALRESDINELCNSMVNNYENLINNVRQVTKLKCELSNNPGHMGKSVYSEFYNFITDVHTIQNIFWIDSKNLVTATLSCSKEDCVIYRDQFKKILLSIESM